MWFAAAAMLLQCSSGGTGISSTATLCGTVTYPSGACPEGSLLNAAYGCTGNLCSGTQVCSSDSQNITCTASPLHCGLAVFASDYKVVSGATYCAQDSDCPATTACSTAGMCFGLWCPGGQVCSTAGYGATCMGGPDAGETDASDDGGSPSDGAVE